MKYLFLLLVLAVPFLTDAQDRGIGVSPARIDSIEVPYTIPLFVTNFSSDKELFEVTGVIANPGRFVLESGETGRIIINFEEPEEGVIRVSATRVSSEGLTTGTGIQIPYKVGDPTIPVLTSPTSSSLSFSSLVGKGGASIGEVGNIKGVGNIGGGIIIIMILLSLWFFARQRLRVFAMLFGVLVFGVLLGWSLKETGYLQLSASPVQTVQNTERISVDITFDYGNGLSGQRDVQAFVGEALFAGDTVLDLLYILEEEQGIAIETRNFPGLGQFIEAIHGVRNTNNSYWQYWVNDEYAKVGAGQYVLQDGDKIIWRRTDEMAE